MQIVAFVHEAGEQSPNGQLRCWVRCSSALQLAKMQAFTAQRTFSRARTVNVQAKESRIGMKPIPVPKGVTIKLQGQSLSVKVSSDELVTGRPQKPAPAERKLNCVAIYTRYLEDAVWVLQ